MCFLAVIAVLDTLCLSSVASRPFLHMPMLASSCSIPPLLTFLTVSSFPSACCSCFQHTFCHCFTSKSLRFDLASCLLHMSLISSLSHPSCVCLLSLAFYLFLAVWSYGTCTTYLLLFPTPPCPSSSVSILFRLSPFSFSCLCSLSSVSILFLLSLCSPFSRPFY